MIHKLTLVEKIADYAVETDCSIETAIEAVSEQFVEDIIHGNRKDMEMTYEEIDVLGNAITETLESFSEDVQDLIDEWNEDAIEIEDERRRGLNGQY